MEGSIHSSGGQPVPNEVLSQAAHIADKIIDGALDPLVPEVDGMQSDEIQLGALQLPDGDPKVAPAVRILPR